MPNVIAKDEFIRVKAFAFAVFSDLGLPWFRAAQLAIFATWIIKNLKSTEEKEKVLKKMIYRLSQNRVMFCLKIRRSWYSSRRRKDPSLYISPHWYFEWFENPFVFVISRLWSSKPSCTESAWAQTSLTAAGKCASASIDCASRSDKSWLLEMLRTGLCHKKGSFSSYTF